MVDRGTRRRLVLLASVLVCGRAVPVGAATFVVDDAGTTVDATPGDGACAGGVGGVCTLTAAIQEANAFPGDDVVELPAGSYPLSAAFSTGGDGSSQGLPPITSDVTISGEGQATTVVERTVGTFRLLTVEGTGSLLVAGLTLAGGDPGAFDGGAVLVRGGTLVLVGCSVLNHTGTAVVAEAGSTVIVSGCTFAGNLGVNGGALRSSFAAVTVGDSTFSFNESTNQGGALWHEGDDAAPLAVATSTVNNNTTAEAGGGVFTTGDPRLRIERSTFASNHGGDAGGAIAAAGGFIHIANSTLSNNDAVSGGALAAFGGAPLFELASATVTRNVASGSGGGLAGAAQLRNTILADNQAGGSGQDCALTGPISSQGHNLLGSETGCDWTSGTGDLVGTDALPMPPGLAALADNGGPTQTRALTAASAAGEAGNPGGCTDTDGVTALTSDQRGQPRALDGDSDAAARCDIGAYEAPAGTFAGTTTSTTAPTSTTVSTTVPTTSSSTSTSSSSTTTTSSTSSTSSTTTTSLPLLAGFARACVPSTFFSSGTGPKLLVTRDVDDLSLAPPRIVWQGATTCGTGPGVPSARIRRIAVQCSGIRTLFDANPPGRATCTPYQIRSTVVADKSHVYWLDDLGLRKLSLNANVGDEPALISISVPIPAAAKQAELALLGPDHLAVLVPDVSTFTLLQVDKTTGVGTLLWQTAGMASDLQSADDQLYLLVNGTLREVDVPQVLDGQNDAIRLIASPVTAFVAEGPRQVCIGTACVPFRMLFYASGGDVFAYSVLSGTADPDPVFTSPDQFAVITELAATASNLFLFERSGSSVRLVKTLRVPGSNASVPLRQWAGLLGGEYPTELTTASFPAPAGDFVFWHERGQLWRLSAAEAPPQIDVQATKLEVTQAIQDLDNSVPLVAGKRTFVRAFARSYVTPIATGVTALLYATWTDNGVPGGGGPLVPMNPKSPYLTLPSVLDRTNLDTAFLFEIPSSWTYHDDVRFEVVVNPNEFPPEFDYTNNTVQAGPLDFRASRRLRTKIIGWGFTPPGGVPTHPHLFDDVLTTISWIRRAYPLASTPGGEYTPTPGFRPEYVQIFDGKLVNFINRTRPECFLLYPADKRNLCASWYTNARMHKMRVAECGGGFQGALCQAFTGRLYYGMIPDLGTIGGVSYFPRGQASGGPRVSSGPVGPPGGGTAWDTDTTDGDWYAGHEIAHTLGRKHPSVGNKCGHSASDASFPYSEGAIGPNSGPKKASLAGFDVGGGPYGDIPMSVLPSATWRDFMTYCSNQWASDYTYKGILSGLEANPGTAALVAGGTTGGPSSALVVSGGMSEDGTAGAFAVIERLQGTDLPAAIPDPGPFTLRVLGPSETTLADYPFAAETSEGGAVAFGLVVPLPEGAAAVTLLGTAGELARHPLSPNPPAVQNVQLVPPPTGPVSGMVDLVWDASDPDADALTFDVHYSRNGGTTFEALATGLDEAGFAVDTTNLGGGTGVLRVEASDGTNTARGDSAPFEVTIKPPQPIIAAPASDQSFVFGQLVSLQGEAPDAQDGFVAAEGLVWTLDDDPTPLGTGFALELEEVAVGVHTLTLSATNADGLSAETSMAFTVNDFLDLPGPTLSVAPLQLAFHVGPGDTAPVLDEITISNVGDGTFDWIATEDAPWLSVSPASGSAPATFTVAADPNQVTDGQSLQAIINLSTVATELVEAQTIAVPVFLGEGDLFEATGGSSTTSTTLSTTTTTTLPVCVPDDCDDNDACTADVCVNGTGCTHTEATGLARASCLCGVLPDACAGQVPPASVSNKTTRTCAALADAEDAAGKRLRKLLSKAVRLLKKAQKKATRAGAGGDPALTPACAEALGVLLGEQRTRVLDARDG
jgi:hypothetical protein